MTLIRCTHEKLADIRFHDGALPHVIGACNYQVIRASKNPDYSPEKHGFTYNHAPMLAYWNGYFWYEYLSGPKGEHETPSVVFLCRSKDGIHWDAPFEIFGSCEISIKPYRGPGKELIHDETVKLVAHHRMGFFTSSSNHFLVTTFYGICPNAHINPNNGYGVGRVVREIYEDGSLSDIYFLRYNEAGGYSREYVNLFAPYTESGDSGFIDACHELLHDKVVTQQWWEEEQLDKEFFSCSGGKALSYYTLPDGRIIGVFKNALTSISEDNGKTWTVPQKSPDIITSTGKVWGQRIPDGRYALVYNPSPDSAHRWPLAITTGENGQDFEGLAAIVPEIPPCRYEGALKNLGAQYIRGITEANHVPDDNGIWLAYSMNKEDMWITRIPGTVCTEWNGNIDDNMANMSEAQLRDIWNLSVPAWGGAELANGKLHLWDSDPYNRTRAERIFQASESIKLSIQMLVTAVHREPVSIQIQSFDGQILLSILFLPDGSTAVRIGGNSMKFGTWKPDKKLTLTLNVHCREYSYDVQIKQDETISFKKGSVGAAVRQAQRVVIASKYTLPFQGLEVNGRNGDIGNLPDADKPIEKTEFYISSLQVK